MSCVLFSCFYNCCYSFYIGKACSDCCQGDGCCTELCVDNCASSSQLVDMYKQEPSNFGGIRIGSHTPNHVSRMITSVLDARGDKQGLSQISEINRQADACSAYMIKKGAEDEKARREEAERARQQRIKEMTAHVSVTVNHQVTIIPPSGQP